MSGPPIPLGFASDKFPDIGVEAAEFLLNFEEGASVGDGRGYFQTISNDAGIGQQGADFSGIVRGDNLRIEIVEDLAIAGALAQNGVPAKAGLRAFENQEFKEHAVVMDRNAPFLVVISDVPFVAGPMAATHEIWRIGIGQRRFRFSRHFTLPEPESECLGARRRLYDANPPAAVAESILESVTALLQRPFEINSRQLGNQIGDQQRQQSHDDAGES